MVPLTFLVLLAAAFASGERCSMTITVDYPTEEGLAPSISTCEQECSPGTEVYVMSSTAYKKFPELDAYGFMVKVNYEQGQLQGCSLVRTESEEEMKNRVASDVLALSGCPALPLNANVMLQQQPLETATPEPTTTTAAPTTTTAAPTTTTTAPTTTTAAPTTTTAAPTTTTAAPTTTTPEPTTTAAPTTTTPEPTTTTTTPEPTTTTTTPEPTTTTTTTTPEPTTTTTTTTPEPTTTLPPIQYCASGFTRVGDFCYLIGADSTSRQTAQTYCQALGGDLAVIYSQAEQDLVTGILDRDVWIMPTDQQTLGTFLPNSGFANWAGNGPLSSSQSTCVSVLQGGAWSNDDCSLGKYALCKKEPERYAPEYSCPAGQTLFRDSCYFVTSSSANYDSGKLSCLHAGARPVFINDQDEQDFVGTLTNEVVYIGIDDIATENTFLSIAHGKAIYTNWSDGEPNDANYEDCVQMYSDSGRKWNDIDCGYYYKMICETSAAPVTRCPVGFNKFGDTCLGVTETQGTVGSGNGQCEAIGGYFAVPESLEEQNFVARFLQQDTLIASTRVARQTMHDFARLDGIPFSYQGWHPDEPNDLNGEDCVQMRQAYGYLWNDTDCSTVAPFLCRTPGLP